MMFCLAIKYFASNVHLRTSFTIDNRSRLTISLGFLSSDKPMGNNDDDNHAQTILLSLCVHARNYITI